MTIDTIGARASQLLDKIHQRAGEYTRRVWWKIQNDNCVSINVCICIRCNRTKCFIYVRCLCCLSLISLQSLRNPPNLTLFCQTGWRLRYSLRIRYHLSYSHIPPRRTLYQTWSGIHDYFLPLHSCKKNIFLRTTATKKKYLFEIQMRWRTNSSTLFANKKLTLLTNTLSPSFLRPADSCPTLRSYQLSI